MEGYILFPAMLRVKVANCFPNRSEYSIRRQSAAVLHHHQINSPTLDNGLLSPGRSARTCVVHDHSIKVNFSSMIEFSLKLGRGFNFTAQVHSPLRVRACHCSDSVMLLFAMGVLLPDFPFFDRL